MSVRLFHNNVKADTATIVASSQAQYLPGTNVQNPFRGRVWQSGNTLTYETLTYDMGTPVTVDAAIAFYTTLEETVSPVDGPITISGNSINSFVTSPAPPFTATLAQSSVTDAVSPQQYFSNYFGTSPGSPTYRYWQIKIKKSSSGETFNLGRVFLGQTYDLAALPMFNGVQIMLTDNSNKSKGTGLNTFTEVLPQFKVVTLNLQPMSTADVAALDTILYRLGQNTNFYMQIDQIAPYQEILYVKLAANHAKKTSIIGATTQYWSVQLVFEEQL